MTHARIDKQQIEDKKATATAAKRALRELIAPIRVSLGIGRALSLLSAVAAIAPYVALTRLGDVLIPAYLNGTAVDSQRLHQELRFLIFAFLTRLGDLWDPLDSSL